MVTTLKELDGGRSIELELRDGVVYLEGGRFCLHFDAGIFLRAIERTLGVTAHPMDKGVDQPVQVR